MFFGQSSFNGKKISDLEASGQRAKTFEDVGGCEKAKEAILEIIDFIKAPEAYQKMGLRMPKGVLLHGLPGTGKTLIAKAAAREAGIPFIFTSGSEFVEIYVGNGAKRVRELFSQARSCQVPVMIFIDEIDAVGYKRNQYGQANREQEQTLNQLLNEMDGFVENDRIVVVAATNIADSLDPALLRPGRFDRKVEISLPTASERQKIFEIHLRSKPHSLTTTDLEEVAKNMDGYAGADIEQIVNRVGLQAVRTARLQKRKTISKISR
jgi:cell division protease FtsH